MLLEGGGAEGVQSQIRKKYVFLNKIMPNS